LITRALLAAAWLGVVAASPARAQGVELRAEAAGVMGMARTGVIFPTGIEAKLGVRIPLPSLPVQLQVDGAFARSPGDSATAGIAGLRQDIWSATAALVYRIPVFSRARVVPYVLAGGGLYHRPSIDPLGFAFTTGGLQAGAGADGRLLGVPIFLEARYTDVLLSTRDVEYLSIGAGIRLGRH
jgi:hypothetical protein